MKPRLIAAFAALLPVLAFAQSPQQGTSGPGVIEGEPPEVEINGKPASQLSEDELREFLQQKVETVYQSDNEELILRVAPGYPLVLTFSDPMDGAPVVGDPQALSATVRKNHLILKVLDSSASDTSMTVFFRGGKKRLYHVFIEPNLVKAELAMNVSSFEDSNGSGGSPVAVERIAEVANTVANWEAMAAAHAIPPNTVRRVKLFWKSDEFVYYWLYSWKDGLVAVTFAWRNPYPFPVRLDQSRLQVHIGDHLFTPDWVTVEPEVVDPEKSATGVLVVANPPFSPTQPFELYWQPAKESPSRKAQEVDALTEAQ
ncbi:hypothetical protein [Verrucomicrobium sp. 3C]|uniref:hypothetical protein n=1 Tax=Verrucomicrobium sp. 3C TaxID=1134055 RepID=UPI000361EA52|nr:hypothetical protein [Verrucomicrobium sp. 3C]